MLSLQAQGQKCFQAILRSGQNRCKAPPGVGNIMRFKIGNLHKQVAQLHRSLKRFPSQPAPEDVHRLRRQIRTLEAIVDALTSGREREDRHLLKTLIRIDKSAGKVRDMDVLVELACSLRTGHNDECLVQLLEYLGDRRFKAAAKLQAIISAQREKACHSLERCPRLIDKSLSPSKTSASTTLSMNTAALVQSLSRELSNSPRLNKDSLHSYRLKIKELRSILQLLTEGDKKFIADLGEAKDAIGKWHDWNELAAITERVVGRGPACGVQRQVQQISRQKLKRAIAIANEIRNKSLRSVTSPENGRQRKIAQRTSGIMNPAFPALSQKHAILRPTHTVLCNSAWYLQ